MGVKLPVVTRYFSSNDDALSIAAGNAVLKPYTWDTESRAEMALILNAATKLEDLGWSVGIQSPVSGIQRSFRIPVLAVQEKRALLVKPASESKKVNISGLKMLEIKHEAQKLLKDFQLTAVVLLDEPSFDERRRSSSDYEVWLRGTQWLS